MPKEQPDMDGQLGRIGLGQDLIVQMKTFEQQAFGVIGHLFAIKEFGLVVLGLPEAVFCPDHLGFDLGVFQRQFGEWGEESLQRCLGHGASGGWGELGVSHPQAARPAALQPPPWDI